MNQRRIALFGLLASVAAFAVPTVRADAPAPTHIAVVNVKEVFSKLAELKEVQTHVSRMNDDLTAMQKSHAAQLDDLQHQIANVKVGSSQHSDMMEKFDETQLDFVRQEKLQQVKMVREQNHEIVNAFNNVQAAVADIAKKRGYDLVLVNSDTELPPNLGDANQETVTNLIMSRNVLYVGDKVNITADVVTQLNSAHDAAGAAPPAAPGK